MLEIHSDLIDKLEEAGADPDRLWLVEAQTINSCAEYYGDYVRWDLTANSPDHHNCILYYHESGDIHQHANFNLNDRDSISQAVNCIADYLKGGL